VIPMPGLADSAPAYVQRAAARDDAAFVALIEQYKSQVFRWALALCGDDDEAEDITQEVFVRVHEKASTFAGSGSFDGWLYRITRRVFLRSRRTAVRRAQLAPAHTAEVYLTDPGARVDRQRAVELIRSVAEQLPLRQREVFVLCDLDGRTSAEAATMLGIKDVTARASLFKARANIRRSILASHPAYTEARS